MCDHLPSGIYHAGLHEKFDLCDSLGLGLGTSVAHTNASSSKLEITTRTEGQLLPTL